MIIEIRDLRDMCKSSVPTETQFAKRFLAIHKRRRLAQAHWERSVVLEAKAHVCEDDGEHTRCCEMYALAKAWPLSEKLDGPVCHVCREQTGHHLVGRLRRLFSA